MQNSTLLKKYFFIYLIFVFSQFIAAQTYSADKPVVTPEWSKGAIWYQIFPERFRNGTTENDPTSLEVTGSANSDWQISSWTSGWYTRLEWEKKRSDNFYDTIFNRFYGGDLVGVIEKLDYLADLGVTAIYFNPIFEAHSIHKYDASSYHHIDANFGNDRDADIKLMANESKHAENWEWSSADKVFLSLLEEAHKRGIRVIIDGVFNHVGRRFWAFQDILKNRENSEYANWFTVTKWDNPNTPQDEMEYASWWNFPELPEFREDENGPIKEIREHIWQITKRWMDPNGDGDPSDGVDGWRLDVVPDVSINFWRDWCSYVRTLNPDAYITAEVWDEAQKWIANDIFNSVMNYPFAKATVNFFIDTNESRINPEQFGKELERLLKLYDPEVTSSLMNLVGSHDTDRMASMVVNPNRQFDRMAGLRDNKNYLIRKPDEKEQKIHMMMATLQATFPGAPMIYYGDEVGMWGGDDPDDRKPMVWEDLKYEDETYNDIGKDIPPASVEVNQKIFSTYKKLFNARKKYPALKSGSFKVILADNDRGLFGFEREFKNDKVQVYFNRSETQQKIKLNSTSGKTDILGNKVTDSDANAILVLPAFTSAVLVQ